ncbi:MAG: hypothetical protein RIE32_04720 [Phycisphaerales bacterium]
MQTYYDDRQLSPNVSTGMHLDLFWLSHTNSYVFAKWQYADVIAVSESSPSQVSVLFLGELEYAPTLTTRTLHGSAAVEHVATIDTSTASLLSVVPTPGVTSVSQANAQHLLGTSNWRSVDDFVARAPSRHAAIDTAVILTVVGVLVLAALLAGAITHKRARHMKSKAL